MPNILRTFVLFPDHFLGWWGYFDDRMRGPAAPDSLLTMAQREMVAVVVSAENRCHYCMLAYRAACRLRTKDPVLVDRLLTNHHRADLEPAESAMLEYAVMVASVADKMTTEDVDVMRRVGWGDKDILHITEIVAMSSYTGRLANPLGLIANPQYGEMERHPPR